MAERFGSWKGAHNRLRKWAADGNVRMVFTALLAQADAEGDLDWVVAVDSTIVRAHQHAAGARRMGPTGEPDDDALPAMTRAGRRRGTSINVLRVQESPKARPERSTTTV
ncbi:hypothetical protein ACGF5T_11110 [Streptomyces sp. NPDC047853]|uniref:hypothetical protein n=1 Tax=unclassified Streptomyces TaxID=2593676 RepID=UPI003453E97B